MVLRGAQTYHRRTRDAGEVRHMRRDKTGARPRRFGYLVQFGALAVFNARMAGEHGGLPEVLSDKPADHWLRHPVFLGGADDHAGDSLYGQGSLPRRLSAHASAHGKRGENVQVQRDGTGSGGAQSAVRYGRDAVLPSFDGGARNGHCFVRRPPWWG